MFVVSAKEAHMSDKFEGTVLRIPYSGHALFTFDA